jgi:hypothetical protein
MSHKTVEADVRRAFARYKAVTRDEDAVLTRTGTSPAFYRVDGELLRAELQGADRAYTVLTTAADFYTIGYRDAREEPIAAERT